MNEFRGVPITQLSSNGTRWDYPFPSIRPNSYHKVLFEIPIDLNSIPKPHYNRDDTFNAEIHVRLPYIKKADTPPGTKPHWDIVTEALLQPIRNGRQLEAVIRSYLGLGNKFRALHHLFERKFTEDETAEFFQNILPEIIQLALNLPNIIPGNVPYLKSGASKSVSLSQHQVSCILANAFLCTYNHRDRHSKVPGINFDRLFYEDPKKSVLEKLICIIHYFKRIITEKPLGVVTFERKHKPESQLPRLDGDFEAFSKHKIHISSIGTIEDNGQGFLQVDFANKFVGGGVLGQGCVQEEIRFVICPELIISRLFTEELKNNEALLIIGAEQFSKYSGYGNTFKWAGRFNDRTPYDVSTGRRKTSIIAIDALHFQNTQTQFKTICIKREIYKAYIGFSQYQQHSPSSKDVSLARLAPIATGNWGCGAFNGNPHLKFVIQLIAATMAKRDVAYFTFSDTELMLELWNIYSWIGQENITIKQLWRLMCGLELPCKNFFKDIQAAYLKSKIQPSVNKPEYQKLNFKRACSSNSKDDSLKMDTTELSLSKRAYEQDKSNNLLVDANTEFPSDLDDSAMDTAETENKSQISLNNIKIEKGSSIKNKIKETDIPTEDFVDVMAIINALHNDSIEKETSTARTKQEKTVDVNTILSIAEKPNMSTANELPDVIHIDDNDNRSNSRQKIVKRNLNSKITDYFKAIDK